MSLLISNTTGTPNWLRSAACTEFYIKTGLVLLGAEVLFGRLLALGLPGVFVSWVVTPIVLVVTFWFGQRILRIASPTLNIVISADMSVCGVSAAIATAAACRAKRSELSLAIGLSLTFTVIMMIVMPLAVRAMGISNVVGGAWIGGTIDATGAVAAAGAMLGEDALQVAATVKMIQNILIGVVAFGVSVYWVTRVERTAGGARPGAIEIWHRFPKFILGFIATSLVFSWLAASSAAGERVVDTVLASGTTTLRNWFFCLAFVSITFLNSTLTREEDERRCEGLQKGAFFLVYVTPERLGSEKFLRMLIRGKKPVIRVAIDETHCVSLWGQSFRPEYLLLRDVLRRLGCPPVLLLTATAPPEVRSEVVRQLEIDLEDEDFIHAFYQRGELTPGVQHVRATAEKYRVMLDFIRERLERAGDIRGIVYTQFATAGEDDDSWENCREIAHVIKTRLKVPVAVYHGKLAPPEKAEQQARFTEGDARILVATNAFGLGIDLPDISWIVHFYMPPSLLDYYQEIGRGGRRGRPCSCLLLYDPNDRTIAEHRVYGNVASPKVIERRFRQLIEGAQGHTGLRGPHEVLYDRREQVLFFPFRPTVPAKPRISPSTKTRTNAKHPVSKNGWPSPVGYPFRSDRAMSLIWFSGHCVREDANRCFIPVEEPRVTMFPMPGLRGCFAGRLSKDASPIMIATATTLKQRFCAGFVFMFDGCPVQRCPKQADSGWIPNAI